MTQQEIKELARNMVGDGGTPNKWFVTTTPYIAVEVDSSTRGEAHSFELIDGYDKDKDACTYGPFDTYEDAVDCYDAESLDVDAGVGQVLIEDRECGTVREKWLTKTMVVEYVEDEVDDSKLFYKQ